MYWNGWFWDVLGIPLRNPHDFLSENSVPQKFDDYFRVTPGWNNQQRISILHSLVKNRSQPWSTKSPGKSMETNLFVSMFGLWNLGAVNEDAIHFGTMLLTGI